MMARPGRLADVSTGQLRAELAQRQKALPRLLRRKAKLEKAIVVIDAQIAMMSGRWAPVSRRTETTNRRVSTKPSREGSLKWHLAKALAGKKGVGVADAVKAVRASGYKSQSKNFHLLVNQTLLNEPEFRKVSRGVFTVKGKPGRKPAVKAKDPAPKQNAAKGAARAAHRSR